METSGSVFRRPSASARSCETILPRERPSLSFSFLSPLLYYCTRVMHEMLHKEEAMKALTVRNLPPEVVRIIRRKASEKRTSANKAVISLLEERVGIRGKEKGQAPVYHDLDALAGSWTKEEAAAFDKALRRQRGIDPGDWK